MIRDYSAFLVRFVDVKLFWFLASVVVLLALLSLLGVSREVLHIYTFPFILLLFRLLPRSPSHRLPAGFVIAVLVLWLGSALSIRGYLGAYHTDLYLAQRSEDRDGEREFVRQLNVLAQSYRLPRARFLYRNFPSRESAREWLAGREVGVGMLWGGEDLQLLLSSRAIESGGEREEAGVRTRQIPFGGEGLHAVLTPAAVPLGGERTGILFPYLLWLTDGLRPRDNVATPVSRSLQSSSLQSASTVAAWAGEERLRGIARFYLGTLALLDSVESGGIQEGDLNCAERHLSQALGSIGLDGDVAEFRAAIFNNLAVVVLLRGGEAREVVQLFRRAAAVDGTTREGVLGAFVARRNLEKLGIRPKRTRREKRG